MNIVLEYIKYRLNAKGRHGIHSPFVYDLVDNCMQIQISDKDKQVLLNLAKNLRSDNHSIEVQDFGAGSKKMSNSRQVQQLYKTSASKGKYGKLLYQLAKHYRPERILEFGTSIGIGTIHLALGHADAHITTVEACANTLSIANKNFQALNNTKIETKNQTFCDFLVENSSNPYDLIFIDGHHDGTALEVYLEKLRPSFHDETLIVLDDIRWSASMFEAWQKLVISNQFNVSIDFFRMGILVPRSSQMKEHFVLKL